jgi:hypothetical protein
VLPCTSDGYAQDRQFNVIIAESLNQMLELEYHVAHRRAWDSGGLYEVEWVC